MKIALIGASGFVGSIVLKEALARGHSVTAIARHAEKVETAPGVTVVPIDASDAKALAKVLAGHDVAISAFNPGWGDPDIYNKHLNGSKAIIAAAKTAGVRLIMVGGGGSLFVAPGVQLVDTAEFPAEWKPGALAARDALTAIQAEKALDWAFVSPPIHLVPGEKTGRYRLGDDNPVFDAAGESRVSVGDLAAALVDESETPNHTRKRFTLGY